MPRVFFLRLRQTLERLPINFRMFFFAPTPVGGKKKMQKFTTFVRCVVHGSVLLHGVYHCTAAGKSQAVHHMKWRVASHFGLPPSAVCVWVLNAPLVPPLKKYNNSESYRWR